MHVQAAMHTTLCENPELAEHVTLFPYGLGESEQDCWMWNLPKNIGDGKIFCGAAGQVRRRPSLG